jgi:hypothetical protein
MKCPICNVELKEQKHFWSDPDSHSGVISFGLPKDWYSYSNRKPQDGGFCTICYTHYVRIKNGDVYEWSASEIQWKFFFKDKVTVRNGATPIGGRWVQ